MTRTDPPAFKSKTALLEWMVSRAESLAADLRRSSPRNAASPEIDLRLQMASLLQCADFVLQVSEAGAEAAPATVALPEYLALDMGHLRSKGYLDQDHEEGMLTLWRRKIILPFAVDRDSSGEDFALRVGAPRDLQRLRVTATHPSFGGRRFWFVCPGFESGCGNRVLRLYRTLDGGPFACHACHKAAHDGGWRSARDRKILVSTVQRAG